MENLNEGKKKKGGMAYEAALREIDAQSAVVALEAKIEKLKEMAETKAQRLEMVSEDENLSELIDKKAMNEMRKEIKQIEKMQEKLEKLYEKKNGKKAPKIVDEEEKVDEMQDPNTGVVGDDSMIHDYLDEGGYDSNYEEDDVKEETNEEYLRMQKLAGVISEEEYKNRLNEEYKGKDLLGALKELQKKLTAEKFNVAPLQTGRDFSDEIKNKVANNPNLAAITLDKSGTHALQATARIIVNGMASSKLDSILKSMGFEEQKVEKGEKIAKNLQEPGSIYIGNETTYKLGKDGYLNDIILYQLKD